LFEREDDSTLGVTVVDPRNSVIVRDKKSQAEVLDAKRRTRKPWINRSLLCQCNFGFANGWRSAITRAIMRHNLDAGPVDSLSRLKRAAGQRYAALRESGYPVKPERGLG
jgi:hypothetical protein